MSLARYLSGRSSTVLLLVFGTPLWPYSGFGFNQPLAALFLWSAVLGVFANSQERRNRLLASGAYVGLAMLTRHEMAGAAVLLGGYLAVRDGSTARLVWRGSLSAGGCLVPSELGAFRKPLESGYFRDQSPGFGSSLLVGATGLLFS